MIKSNFLLKITVLAVLLFNFLPVIATVHRVNNNPAYNVSIGCVNCVYNDLANAISNANANDTLLIEGSNYNGGYPSITINKKLVLIGPGYFLTGTGSNPNLQYNGISTNVDEIFLDPGSAGTVLEGLEVINEIHVNESNITIKRCHASISIDDSFWNGYQFNNILITQCYIDVFQCAYNNNLLNSIYNLTVTNNIFDNNSSLYFTDNITASTFRNNVFNFDVYTSDADISFIDNIFYNSWLSGNNISTCNVQYNIFCNPHGLNLNCPETNYVVSAGSIFIGTGTSSDDGYWQINSAICTPCATGSSTGGEIGMFGSPSPYKLSGIPNIPTIYNLNPGASILQGGTTPVTISTRSNN